MSKKDDKIKWISPRISFKRHQDYSGIVISARIDRWKEGLLLAWLISWTFIGGYFVYTLTTPLTQDQKTYMIILLSFWAYFEFRIFKAWRWRRWGTEFIRINEETLMLKKGIGKYGKAYRYDLENIKNLALIDRPPHALTRQFESSFWVIGGEMLQFEYLGKTIIFGRQISDEEAAKLLNVLMKEVEFYGKRLN
jgi:hypothetical protein